MRAVLDIHRDLLSLAVPHEVVRLPTGVLTADDLPQALGLPPTSCVAVRCYVSDRGFVAVAVHARVVPDAHSVVQALGARSLRLASADETSAATDYAAGLVSPLGLPPEVALLADRALATRDVLYCPVGEPGVALGLRSALLLETTGAQVIALGPLPLPRPAADLLLDRGRRGGDRSGR